jgi:hypothetical protein
MDAAPSAHPVAGKTHQEIEMSKGNKEAKKPKRAVPVVKVPATANATPPPSSGSKPMPGKR